MYQCADPVCLTHRAFTNVDLENVKDDFIQRCKYVPESSMDEYLKLFPETSWGTSYANEYRIICRRRLDNEGANTLIASIIPPGVAHVDTIFGIAINDNSFPIVGAMMMSIVYDFFVRTLRKSDFLTNTMVTLPYLPDCRQNNELTHRALLLSCVTKWYSPLWGKYYDSTWEKDKWSKEDSRLKNDAFTRGAVWNNLVPLRSEYSRRQAQVEIDVLTAMALGMTLEQLKMIYRIQFPVMQQYEADTWYDINGRVVFSSKNYGDLTYKRNEWEKNIKGAEEGQKFYKTITDNTMPEGSVERTIEYIAPFDCCDREQDYETAWKFFEEKYKNSEQ